MVLAQITKADAANPRQPDGSAVLMMLACALFAVLPIVLVALLVLLLARWIRSSSLAAAESGELGAEISRRVDSIERRLSGIEKTLNEVGEQP